MFPARYAHILFAFILSAFMSCLVSGVSSLLNSGWSDGFLYTWLVQAWLPSWAIAFPAVLLVAPLARRLVAALTKKDG